MVVSDLYRTHHMIRCEIICDGIILDHSKLWIGSGECHPIVVHLRVHCPVCPVETIVTKRQPEGPMKDHHVSVKGNAPMFVHPFAFEFVQ